LGQPTPDPALLANVGSPTTLGWNYPPGVPTPDPALLAGVPDTVTWGYPPGSELCSVVLYYMVLVYFIIGSCNIVYSLVPTPDPALLEGTAVTMTWGCKYMFCHQIYCSNALELAHFI
jgi:hypothetical protein